jgi:thymidine kinase
MVGAAIGFVVCGLMTSGKTEDLEHRLHSLRLSLRAIKDVCASSRDPVQSVARIDSIADLTLRADREIVQ